MNGPGAFRLDESALTLPRGAWGRTRRRLLSHEGRPLLGFTQGRFRPCLFPVLTQAGFLVTSESPADHPHHTSLWVGADHVHAALPAADGHEWATYNFYVDDVFQGRAPGRQVASAITTEADGPAIVVTECVDWRGPPEWGAPDGRVVLRETRRARVHMDAGCYGLMLESCLAATEWAVSIGPTRHAFFNMRVAETMVRALAITTDQGGVAALPAIAGARWVDLCGPVGGGHQAGIAMLPDRVGEEAPTWFVAAWGVATGGGCRRAAHRVEPGTPLVMRCRFVVHDGAPDPPRLEAMFAALGTEAAGTRA